MGPIAFLLRLGTLEVIELPCRLYNFVLAITCAAKQLLKKCLKIRLLLYSFANNNTACGYGCCMHRHYGFKSYPLCTKPNNSRTSSEMFAKVFPKKFGVDIVLRI